jgi:hypothetical protein
MSDNTDGTPLSGETPTYLTTDRAAALAGVDPRTVHKNIKAAAHYVSAKGDKRYPLYAEATILRFRAERQAGAE